MRVFPNGFGFAALLVLAIYSAWEWPEIVHGFNDWAGGFLSKFVLFSLFFLQGLKMEKKKLFGAFENPLKLLAVQVGIFICPLFMVFIGYSLGFFEAGWLDAFILLAFPLPCLRLRCIPGIAPSTTTRARRDKSLIRFK